MQIPILNGVFTDNDPSVRTSYPVNLIPVPQQSGISNGYLKPADGIVSGKIYVDGSRIDGEWHLAGMCAGAGVGFRVDWGWGPYARAWR